jgi:hypothetical protein
MVRPRTAWLLLVGLVACSGSIEDPVGNGEQSITGGAGGASNGKCDEKALSPAPVRRLSHVEYNRTVKDLFAGVDLPTQTFAEDLRVHGFENNAKAMNPSPVLIEQYDTSAELIAKLVAAQKDKVLPCMPSSDSDMACGTKAIAALGARAFRRPLTDDEQGRYQAFFAKEMNEISWNAALELTISALLQSPQFLYRLEFGASNARGSTLPLDDYEMASRLSYFLWQSMPDKELFDAAEAGELNTTEEVEAQARRMLDDPRAQLAISDFHRQWLDFDRLLQQNKDPTLFPQWNDSVRASLYEETDRFVRHVFDKDEGSGTVSELLTSTTTFADPNVAMIYGVSVPGPGFSQVELPGDERSGILTLGTFLASRAHSTNGSPPLRGVAVLDFVLCDRPPPPPPTANTSAPMQDPNKPHTNRQLFEERTSPSLCQTCHKQINGIGYAFEAFDSTGKFRKKDNGIDVDATGELIGTDVDGKYDGAVELSHKLAESHKVEACVVRNLYRYAHGRDEAKTDECKLDGLNEALDKAKGDLRELMVQITTTYEFMHRPK